jgi:plastin-1
MEIFIFVKEASRKVVSNFSLDLKDGDAYAVLLNTLAPECCNLCPLESKDLMERAKLILLQAEKLIVKDI